MSFRRLPHPVLCFLERNVEDNQIFIQTKTFISITRLLVAYLLLKLVLPERGFVHILLTGWQTKLKLEK